MFRQSALPTPLRRREFLRVLGQGTLGMTVCSALIGCGGGGGSIAHPITDLGSKFIAVSINNKSQIVGGMTSGPFLWQSGVITDPNTLLPASSGWQLQTAAGINDNGDIVGYGTFQGELLHGYWLQRNANNTYSITDLSSKFVATGINNKGQIVGGLNGNVGGPVLWQNGVITDPNTLLSAGSGWQLQTAAGINDNGDIVGYGTLNGQALHGYWLQHGSTGSYSIVDLGSTFVAAGINNKSQIVGGANGATGGPVLWQNGVITDPNTLLPASSGWQLQTSAGVNDNGDIVGYGTFQGQIQHGYWLKRAF